MDHPSKALLISLGVGVGVAVVVAGGVYYVVNENKARKSAASSAPVAIERRIANEHAGIVIGRGGESVREIERKTETRIVFKAECKYDSLFLRSSTYVYIVPLST